MGWAHEELFRTELEKGAKKASKARIDHLTTLAVQEVNTVRKQRIIAFRKRAQAAAACCYSSSLMPAKCCSITLSFLPSASPVHMYCGMHLLMAHT
jgi:hypothetical protein